MNLFLCYGWCPSHGPAKTPDVDCCLGLEYARTRWLNGCNSSHGGSCCTCGNPLPLPHLHISLPKAHAPLDGPYPGRPLLTGGNVCSEECALGFQANGECPGHSNIPPFRHIEQIVGTR